MSNEQPQPRAVFGEIREDYLAQLGEVWEGIDFVALGVERDGDTAVIPFLGRSHRVSLSQGFVDHNGNKPSHAACVVLAKYLLQNASEPGSGDEWAAYKQFPDAAPFVEGYANTVDRLIAREFAGHGGQLAIECARWGGEEYDSELSYDLVLRIPALPKVPLLLLYNDEEEPFPAQCSVLLKQDASRYLDMECMAMLGMILAQRLVAGLKGTLDQNLLS
ncbi:MAG: DUF3786 domain-containing protein [Deltaproteobacteria bacterium]|nr:DUF3786 domain-containing protein [Deltaproteobacteria bacterium]